MSFRLLPPCDTDRITQQFMRRPEVYSQFGFPGHEGIDYGTPMRSKIYASAAGRVERKEYMDGGYGLWIMLVHEHDGEVYRTIYAHLSEQHVEVGDTVQAGHVIGLSGNTGFSTGPHLHYTLKMANASRNGYTRYRSDSGLEGTYPRDIIDPTPWLYPAPTYIPTTPLHPGHPSLSLGEPSNLPGMGAAVSEPTPPEPEGVEAKVLVAEMNVRKDPSTDNAPIGLIAEGTTIRVDPKAFGTEVLPWYRIVSPDDLRDRWVPQSFDGIEFLDIVESEQGTTLVLNTGSDEAPREEFYSSATVATEAETDPNTAHVIVTNTRQYMLKVRPAPDTATDTLAKIPDGTRLTVKRESTTTGNITWREIVAPAELRGRWAAERFMDTVYLTPVEAETPVVVGSHAPVGVVAPTVVEEDNAVEHNTEQVVVANTGQFMLKVRPQPSIRTETLAKLPDGTHLVVTNDPTEEGDITWRQIVSPAEHKGQWAAERWRDTLYLIPATHNEPQVIHTHEEVKTATAPTTTFKTRGAIDMWNFMVPSETHAHFLSSGEIIFRETLSERSALIRKNKHMEHLYLHTANGVEYVMRGFDDSADYKGQAAAYIPTENNNREFGGLYGHKWLPRYVDDGEVFSSESYVSFYQRESGNLIELAGPAMNYYRIVTVHAEWRGLKNVVQVEWRVGNPDKAPADEVYFFGEGMGYVGWGEGEPRNLWRETQDIHFARAYGVGDRYTYGWFDPATVKLQG